jgi:hypothetical protein
MSGSNQLRKGWILQADYYNNIIYPLQDKALTAFKNSPFYLTGGTALSRGYYNHRYSDDLDYFVNNVPDFLKIVEQPIEKLRNIFKELAIPVRDKDFVRLFVSDGNLKIELINDVPSHIGSLYDHPLMGKVDSKENILANKLTAIVDRALPKDIIDIYFLLNDGLSIKTALTNAETKAAGISPLLIAKILSEFDYALIDREIKWVTPVPWNTIKQYMDELVSAIIRGTL